MVTIDKFSRVISEIYASSLSPANWAVAFSEISHALDGAGSGIVASSGADRWPLCATISSEAVASYRAYYREIDYVLTDVESGPVGLVRGGAEVIAPGVDTEFNADWMRPHDLQDGVFVRLTGTKATSFFVVAPKRSESFDTTERVQFASALIRHLQQALRTQEHLAELRSAAAEITEIINAVRYGIVIVGPETTLLHMNSAAEQIFSSGDGLCIDGRSIKATHTTTNQRLQGVITSALVADSAGVRSGDSLACRRPSGKRCYVIHTLPLTFTSDFQAAAKALVIVVDPEQQPETSKMLIQRLFGLTNAEANVALRVMRGDGLGPISADLALARATVNTHLQHIFDKTDTHRQAELVRLLLASIP